MKTLFITLFHSLLLLNPHLACARGKFALAPSCLTNTNAPFIRDEITLVMESAASTKAALANPTPDTNRFVRWIFGTRTGTYDPYAAPRAIIGGTAGAGGIIGLAGVTGEVPVEEAKGGDVIFFCDMSHMKPIYNEQEDLVQWYDTTLKSYNGPDPALLACNNTKDGNYQGNIQVPSAFSMPWEEEVNGALPDAPDAIIICKWYVDSGLAAAYRDSGDFDDDFFTRETRFWQRRSTPKSGFAPIDYFNLFDSTIAHEISHTRIGNFRDDVAGPNSYTWGNCRTLSSNPNPNTGAPRNVNNFVFLMIANKLTSLGRTISSIGGVA